MARQIALCAAPPLPHTNLQRKPAYQGFAKYTDEINRYGATAPQPARAQSLSSASQAALAALQMHQKPAQPAPQQSGPSYRSNSLSGYNRAPGVNRSNSLQLYVYNPKPSYTAGPPRPARTSSLRSNSVRSSSLTSGPHRHLPLPYESFPEDEEFQEEEDVVTTTKTTKVVDSLGRTKSITTETIRKLPDGSNVIETKTTNISRSGSRSNSLRNNSLNHTNPNYNLDKIDEDLQDFDYTYLDNEHHAHNSGFSPATAPDYAGHQNGPNPHRSPRTEQHIQDRRNELARPAGWIEDRSSSMASTSSARRLKSILKNSSTSAAALEAAETLQSPERQRLEEHLPEGIMGPPAATSPLSPGLNGNHRGQMSNASGASIKFLDTVETISYPAEQRNNLREIEKEESLKKEQEKQKNLELYNKAMQVAMQKVYGDSNPINTPPDSPVIEQTSPRVEEMRAFAEKNSEKKAKKDVKRELLEAAGVNRNYIYENHHRDFTMHSLRDKEGEHLSMKDRAKEEKKLLKEEEKKRAELLKAATKERKKEEKTLKKKEKRGFGLFGRKKGDSISDESAFSSEMADSHNSGYLEPETQVHQAQVTPSHPARESEDAVVPQSSLLKAPVKTSPGASPEQLQPLHFEDYSSPEEQFVDVPEAIDELEPEKSPLPEVHHESMSPSSNFTPNIRHAVESPEPVVSSAEFVQIQPIEESKIPTLVANADGASRVHQIQPIEESKLPTLVANADGAPRVLQDEAINERAPVVSTVNSDEEANKSEKTVFEDADAEVVTGHDLRPVSQAELPLPYLDQEEYHDAEIVGPNATHGVPEVTAANAVRENSTDPEQQLQTPEVLLDFRAANQYQRDHDAESGSIPGLQNNSPVAPPTNYVTSVEQTLLATDLPAAAKQTTTPEVLEPSTPPQTYEPDVQNSDVRPSLSESETSKKPRKEKKRVKRFKNFIDKYFVNNYSR